MYYCITSFGDTLIYERANGPRVTGVLITPPKSGVMRVVGFSGGADSQATALWVRQRFPAEEVLLLNSDVGGHEHPVTTAFIHWYSENIFPVTIISPLIRDLAGVGTREGSVGDRRHEFSEGDVLTMDRLAYIKGRFPSKKMQFCTTFLKLNPQKRWVQENLEARGIDCERYVGLRRDESEDRKNTPDRQWDDFFDCWINFPFATWTKPQIFELLKQAGEEVNPLYLMGFGRVGCAPCVNSNKQDVRQWAARFPERIDMVREWEKRLGFTFFAPIVPPRKKINWVDDVVNWSRTAYGGKQFNLPMIEAEAALGTCSSKYGLCE